MIQVPPFVCTAPLVAGRTQAQLATIIQSAWHKLGHADVRAWTETKIMRMPERVIRGKTLAACDIEIITIHSNLVNGLPPRARGLAIAA